MTVYIFYGFRRNLIKPTSRFCLVLGQNHDLAARRVFLHSPMSLDNLIKFEHFSNLGIFMNSPGPPEYEVK